MIRRWTILWALVAALCLPGLALAQAQEHEHVAAAKGKPVTLMSGLGNWRHPVSTKSVQAQTFFDQGLRLIYAFNHDEAARSFQHAAESKRGAQMLAANVGPHVKEMPALGGFMTVPIAVDFKHLRAARGQNLTPANKPAHRQLI